MKAGANYLDMNTIKKLHEEGTELETIVRLTQVPHHAVKQITDSVDDGTFTITPKRQASNPLAELKAENDELKTRVAELEAQLAKKKPGPKPKEPQPDLVT